MATAAAPGIASTTFEGPRVISAWFFVFFFCSGLCSLLYEVIWLRLGMAAFGVTTPLVSIFLSIFLAGLGLGSWAAGKVSRRFAGRSCRFFVRAYALTELLIGCSAVLVPWELHRARALLDQSMSGMGMGNTAYYVWSGLILAALLLPWCTLMGASFPLAMAAIRKSNPAGAENSFSFLYLANVLGAVLGALLPAFVLVELFGFRQTLLLAATLNIFVFIACLFLSFSASCAAPASAGSVSDSSVTRAAGVSRRSALLILFLTGLASLGMEVTWIRQFTPYLGATIWAFALVLAVYLAATFAGSRSYRNWRRAARAGNPLVWSLIGVAALMPCATSDPRLTLFPLLRFAATITPYAAVIRFLAIFVKLLPVGRVVLGVAPFSALVGFLTPMLVDEVSSGDPERAGTAYSVNVIGCILGPLVASFILLPRFGERWSLVLMSLPLVSLAFRFPPVMERQRKLKMWSVLAVATLALALIPHRFEDAFQQRLVHRDYTATTVATGDGMDKQLFVNGIGLTNLTATTKVMAHLPLALLNHAPHDALDICLGMGTTYRSLASWGIRVTAVELLPSVVASFPYYHPQDPNADTANSRVVVDDGRLFLERSSGQYDVITIDPPPPLKAPASSLLYSKDFYSVLKKHLRAGGILQQWVPLTDVADDRAEVAIVRAAKESFAYLRIFDSMLGGGIHIIASDSPIVVPSAQALVERLPQAAREDFVAWGPAATAEEQFSRVLGNERDANSVLSLETGVSAIDDDHPINEYCLLHRVHLYKRTLTPVSSFIDIFTH